MNNSKLSLLVILLLSLFAGITWGANRHIYALRYPDYTTFSTGEYGVSLLFDTLDHMGSRVSILYNPVRGGFLGVNDAVFIIQPTAPRINADMADDILDWVRRGGRLIFLDNGQPTIIDRALRDEYYMPFGTLRWYRLGMGEVITGRASTVANINLMHDPTYGEGLAYVLTGWNADQIYFAEFYHGFHRADSAFRQMPVWLQLLAFQVIIAAVVVVWHLGKRFGRPVPLYGETERGENEQVFTLARLYKQADRRS